MHVQTNARAADLTFGANTMKKKRQIDWRTWPAEQRRRENLQLLWITLGAFLFTFLPWLIAAWREMAR